MMLRILNAELANQRRCRKTRNKIRGSSIPLNSLPNDLISLIVDGLSVRDQRAFACVRSCFHKIVHAQRKVLLPRLVTYYDIVFASSFDLIDLRHFDGSLQRLCVHDLRSQIPIIYSSFDYRISLLLGWIHRHSDQRIGRLPLRTLSRNNNAPSIRLAEMRCINMSALWHECTCLKYMDMWLLCIGALTLNPYIDSEHLVHNFVHIWDLQHMKARMHRKQLMPSPTVVAELTRQAFAAARYLD